MQVERDFFKASAAVVAMLQRFERPEEIAALVAFVVSPLASGINGAALRVDGGWCEVSGNFEGRATSSPGLAGKHSPQP